MAELCHRFYKIKTANRLEMFALRYPEQNEISVINGNAIPAVSELLDQLDWRQDFAGRIDVGDIYYDFAKLWGGLNSSLASEVCGAKWLFGKKNKSPCGTNLSQYVSFSN